MSRFPRVVTQRMWSAVHRVRRSGSYLLMRRDAQALGDQRWTQLSVFRDASKAAEALDEAAASGEGELDDYRIDERMPSPREWLRPLTWFSPNHA